jgi:hypothetical protein
MNGTTLLLVAVMWVAPATPATPPAAGTGAGQVLRFSGNGGKTIAPVSRPPPFDYVLEELWCDLPDLQ